jgi:hypothetical protein
MKEQRIKITTFIKLDRIDRIKVLLGLAIKVETNVTIPQEQPIEMYNAASTTTIIKSSGTFIKQDLPPFGYMEISNNNN